MPRKSGDWWLVTSHSQLRIPNPCFQTFSSGFAANMYVREAPFLFSLPRVGKAVKLSKILIAHASNSVCFFHPLSLLVNNKIKKLVK